MILPPPFSFRCPECGNLIASRKVRASQRRKLDKELPPPVECSKCGSRFRANRTTPATILMWVLMITADMMMHIVMFMAVVAFFVGYFIGWYTLISWPTAILLLVLALCVLAMGAAEFWTMRLDPVDNEIEHSALES